VPIAQGTKLGQYEVQDFIGQGAMGLVYRAYHAQLERIGAIKVMQAITPDADTVARFRHEAQAIAKLRHPNIVDVYDFGEFQGTPYMIVEYIPGGSLATRMAHGRLDWDIALGYLRGIAAGLDYAHGHGVVHRDVKPANVLMTNEETPVLADFGLAKLLQGSSVKSMTGVTTGTPAYMAPEQVTGIRVGPAADRYSLATIAYEMLTGVIPFDGMALMELLYAQVHRVPPAPSTRNSELGPEVDAVVMRGLAKDPAQRWESATAFVDALAAALKPPPTRVLSETVVMAPPPPRARTRQQAAPVAAAVDPETVVFDPDTLGAFPSPPPTVQKPKPRFSRRRIVLIVAGALVALLAMGVCAIAISATTLSVSPSRAAPGETVTVTATHVPAKQVGEIQLSSALHRYVFFADSNGNVSLDITVPADIEPGNHTLKICWSNSCHKQTQLRVVAETSLASPTPIANTSPSPRISPSPSPKPTASARPTATPHSSPTSTSSPLPPYITVGRISASANTIVRFSNYQAGTATVQVCQNGNCYTVVGPVQVPAGTNYVTFKTPPGIKATALGYGQAFVVACIPGDACRKSNSIDVVP